MIPRDRYLARRQSDALALRQHYGDEADIESAIRAEELADVGDWAGEAIWRRIINAIGQLENTTPPGRLH